MASAATDSALVVDVGGTRLRFAIAARGRSGLRLDRAVERRAEDYPNFYAALADYLAPIRALWPKRVAIAVAAPVAGDEVTLTNRDWRIRGAALAERFGFERPVLVNDFVALANSIPLIPAQGRRSIGNGRADPAAPSALLGPGTGLGVAIIVPSREGRLVIASEGGHASFAPETEREAALARGLQWRHGHVSWERVLSGPGIAQIYEILAELDQGIGLSLAPEQVSARALQGTDRLAVEALQMFASLLGSFAGNLALTAGARGGIFLGGGILPQLGDFLTGSDFRARFEAKGRFAEYLAAIPTTLILEDEPTLLGLAATLWPDLRNGRADGGGE
jgi:glucokinase